MSETTIHPTAVIEHGAELGVGVTVGAFSYIGAGVAVGDRCVLHNHVTLLGPARFGSENEFFPQVVLGAAPQDLKYKGGPTRLEVGSHNTFRECVTVHRGTEVDHQSDGTTTIGNRNLLMVGVHVAHDVQIGDSAIIANAVQLAGHVYVEDCVNIGGAAAIHHYATVGRYALIGGMTRVMHDVPPYMKVQGFQQEVRAVNVEGMRRWGIEERSIEAVREAHRLLYARRGERATGRTTEALRQIESSGLKRDPHVDYLADFLQRKLQLGGASGRVRDAKRTDTAADRAAFYAREKTESKA